MPELRLVPEMCASIALSLVLRYGFTSKSHGLKMTDPRYGISIEYSVKKMGRGYNVRSYILHKSASYSL